MRILPGALIVLTAGLPWYVAMYLRHGAAFTQRLLVHDHINRLARGVHMDETTPGHVGYYVLQLGFATFPWIGLLPFAVVAFIWLYRARRAGDPEVTLAGPGYRDADLIATGEMDVAGYHQGQTVLLLSLWFFSAFVLFSAMATRFHHYIFPAVPPAMLLVGLLIDRMMGDAPSGRRTRVGAALAFFAPLPLVLGVGGLYGDLRGEIPPGEEGTDWVLNHGLSTEAVGALILLGALLWVCASRLLRRPDLERVRKTSMATRRRTWTVGRSPFERESPRVILASRAHPLTQILFPNRSA